MPASTDVRKDPAMITGTIGPIWQTAITDSLIYRGQHPALDPPAVGSGGWPHGGVSVMMMYATPNYLSYSQCLKCTHVTLTAYAINMRANSNALQTHKIEGRSWPRLICPLYTCGIHLDTNMIAGQL